jgi:hypothetical protein
MTVSTEKNRRFGYAGAPAQAGRRIRAVPLLAWIAKGKYWSW